LVLSESIFEVYAECAKPNINFDRLRECAQNCVVNEAVQERYITKNKSNSDQAKATKIAQVKFMTEWMKNISVMPDSDLLNFAGCVGASLNRDVLNPFPHSFNSVFFDALTEKQCASCQKKELPGSKFKYCSGCGMVTYCSKACQKKHWQSSHRKMCSSLLGFDRL